MARTPPEIGVRLRDFNRRHPFEPFEVKTADGDTFHVSHPDFAIVSESGETAEVHERDGYFRVLNLRAVVSIELVRPKKGLLGEGGGKR